MANDLRKVLFEGVDSRVQKALNSPKVQETLQQAVKEEVKKALSGDQLTVAVMNAVRSALGSDSTTTTSEPEPVIPTPNNKPPVARGRPRRAGRVLCSVVGCDRPHRSMGYCASHYQSARTHNWPMPATGPVTPGPEYRTRG